MKITKLHIIRLALSAFITVFIWKVATAMYMLKVMSILNIIAFAQEHDIDTTGIQTEMYLYSLLWYYMIAFILIIAVWRWFGLPRQLYTEQLKGLIGHIFPRYYKKE